MNLLEKARAMANRLLIRAVESGEPGAVEAVEAVEADASGGWVARPESEIAADCDALARFGVIRASHIDDEGQRWFLVWEGADDDGS
jgi:hypothetical protein